ncbi:MATE family efflux transporter [Blattabacterium cuenoti]|uniref:MATE family efflux transporter n=1 Tax=Blattabacterium cuenoti TaxID=1653831 RepID=UPI00163BE460|nr:MATE family efflux transporter [Blattabacterium cuenoti]
MLATPVFFTQLGVIFVGISDNIMVGYLGKKALSSVSLANSIFFIVIIFGLGVSTSISSIISSINAKNNYKKGAIIFYHGLIINFFLSIIMYGLTHVFLIIMPYLGQPPEILDDTVSFLKIISISFIPWMMFEAFRKFSEGLSLILPGLLITWISAIINIILNFLFIKGIWIFPKLGIIGIAFSTLISRIVMLIGIPFLLYRYKKVRCYYNHFKYFFLKKKYLKKILKIGVPSGFHMLFEMSVFSISSFISGKCGVTVLAAHQIVINLVSSTFLLSTGLSVAATVRIGNRFSLKKYSELRMIGKSILLMGFIFMFTCSLFFFFFRNYIPYIFIYNENDSEVVIIAKKMILVASLFQLSDGLQGIILGLLRGLQDTHIPMWISFFSYWIIALPTAWFLSIKIGGIGIWIGLGLGLSISAILLFIRYEMITKKLINYK